VPRKKVKGSKYTYLDILENEYLKCSLKFSGDGPGSERVINDPAKKRYRLGNHEKKYICEFGRPWTEQAIQVKLSDRVKIRVIHSHIEKWGYKKSRDYITKRPLGAGWFKRNMLVRFYAHFRKVWDRKFPESGINKLAQNAHNVYCNYTIASHQHPLSVENHVRNGVTVLVALKGETIFWF
jgi:hypothetical protein